MEVVGNTYVFRSPYKQYAYRNGQKLVVVREAKEGEEVDPECVPLYVARFQDGTELLVWPEELGE